jgi:transcriptional regulator with XRE-family HTH domain
MAKPSPSFAGDPAFVRIGESVRRARKELGLLQEMLAVDAGVDRSYMGGIERGYHNLTPMSLLRIASALECKAYSVLEQADCRYQFSRAALHRCVWNSNHLAAIWNQLKKRGVGVRWGPTG